jgi:hypothetical protein
MTPFGAPTAHTAARVHIRFIGAPSPLEYRIPVNLDDLPWMGIGWTKLLLIVLLNKRYLDRDPGTPTPVESKDDVDAFGFLGGHWSGGRGGDLAEQVLRRVESTATAFLAACRAD